MIRRASALAAVLMVLLGGAARADFSDYGIKSFGGSISTSQAGGRPDFTVSFELKREPSGVLFASTREISINAPPGLLGNPSAFPKCTATQLTTTDVEDPNGDSCPIDSQVGISEVTVFNEGGPRTFAEPVYNMEAPGDEAVARLGFIAEAFPIFVDLRVRSEGDYGVTATVRGAGSLIPLLSASTTLWGVPAAHGHDSLRITPYEALHNAGVPETPNGKRTSGIVPAPFLANPTRCGVPLELSMTASSYALPDQPVSATAQLPVMTGCGKLDFKPSLTLTPTSREAAFPAGLDSTLALPQDENVEGAATSQMRYARVELPKGMTVSPGAADGLAACSTEQVGLAGRGASEAARCPEAAKLASAEIDIPALGRPIHAALYQRTPEPGRLLGVWLVADELGLHLKLPGEVRADPQDGQLFVEFRGTQATEGIPQGPIRGLELQIKSGARAPLQTPSSCGTYFAKYEFVPWSAGPSVLGAAPMTIDQNCDTGGFSPKLSAGSVNPLGGAFSAFVAELTRESDEENVSTLSVTLPPGVLAKVAGVEHCEGAATETGNCPPASRVGSATVATGPGPSPLWLPQPGKDSIVIYLAGPYRSAPYSLVVKAPAQAGPFDLGTVVNRLAIRIDPETAQATVTSDPLPQILEGVPISYRTIHSDIDRPKFVINPTSCEEMAVRSTVVSATGQVADPSARFQVGGCGELPFRPGLSLRLHGKTNRGAHPSLRAVLTARPGDANIARLQAALPRSEFLDQGHIKTICTRVQFAANRCPAGSIYGRAKAITPLLDQPLRGLVYLRSSRHLLPDMVVALRGKIDINAVGRIDSVRGGGLRTTFAAIPDAPLTKVVVDMYGGKKGLLVNSRELCRDTSRSRVSLVAHNDKHAELSPPVRADCTNTH
jgi:hypothetical protein